MSDRKVEEPPHPSQNQAPPNGQLFNSLDALRIQENMQTANRRAGFYSSLGPEFNLAFLEEAADFIINRIGRISKRDCYWCYADDNSEEKPQPVQNVQAKQVVPQVQSSISGVMNNPPRSTQLLEQARINQPVAPAPTVSAEQLQPSWVKLAKAVVPISYKAKPIKVVNDLNRPLVEYDNDVVEVALPQRRMGLHPKTSQLNVGRVSGDKNYVIVENPPFLDLNRVPNGLVFQNKETRLFYTANGRCIMTNRDGYITVFGAPRKDGKKTIYQFGSWSTNPNKRRGKRDKNDPEMGKLFDKLAAAMADAKLVQKDNPEWTPKSRHIARKIAFDGNGNKVPEEKLPGPVKDALVAIRTAIAKPVKKQGAKGQSRSVSPRKGARPEVDHSHSGELFKREQRKADNARLLRIARNNLNNNNNADTEFEEEKASLSYQGLFVDDETGKGIPSFVTRDAVKSDSIIIDGQKFWLSKEEVDLNIYGHSDRKYPLEKREIEFQDIPVVSKVEESRKEEPQLEKPKEE